MKTNRRHIVYLVLFLLLLLLLSTVSYYTTREDHPTENKAHVTFFASDQPLLTITCDIASTPQQRSNGLMHRSSLPITHGMLFVYEQPQNLSFWMKNTLIPLDIIFIDEHGVVINVESADIQPNVADNELKRYKSNAPAQYVVEINKGMAMSYSIKQGTIVSIDYI